MNCIRCGKETEENQVFCKDCLADMERHPVKPGTPILLPNREERGTTKRPSFKISSSKWENQVYRLKRLVTFLWVLVFVLAAALAVCICSILGLMPDWFNEFTQHIGLFRSLTG